MSPDELGDERADKRATMLRKVEAATEAYGDERFREGVKVGLDAAEFVIAAWTTGKGTTKAKLVQWAQDHIDATKRRSGL